MSDDDTPAPAPPCQHMGRLLFSPASGAICEDCRAPVSVSYEGGGGRHMIEYRNGVPKPAPVEPVAPTLVPWENCACDHVRWFLVGTRLFCECGAPKGGTMPSPEPAPASPEEPLTEQQEIDALFKHYRALLDRHGWRETIYAPKDRPIQAITIGSTSIFTAHWLTCAWFVEEARDLWPARLIAWRELPKREASK